MDIAMFFMQTQITIRARTIYPPKSHCFTVLFLKTVWINDRWIFCDAIMFYLLLQYKVIYLFDYF